MKNLHVRLSMTCIATLLISALVTTSCGTVAKSLEPSDQEINAEAAKSYEEVKAKSKLSSNAEWTAMVDRVSKRIAAATGENLQWEVHLFESPEVNAWCMPGGKMAVYTGIMPVLKTEAALAAVMGHEVSHATLRHGKKGYARAMEQNIAGVVLGVGLAAGGQLLCKTETCKLLAAGAGAASGFALAFFGQKFSREDESAADHQGQIYMAKAGYDPAEASRLWDRMGAANAGKEPPEFMSTHPSSSHRKEALSGWLPNAESIYQNSPNKYGLGAAIK